MRAYKWIGLLLTASFSVFGADVLKDNVEYTTSIAGAYDSRSTFTNPAALGFQTDLNGATPLSAFSTSLNANQNNDYVFSMAFGWLGFGIEHLRISSYTPAAPGDELTVVLTVAGAEHARAVEVGVVGHRRRARTWPAPDPVISRRFLRSERARIRCNEMQTIAGRITCPGPHTHPARAVRTWPNSARQPNHPRPDGSFRSRPP